MYGLLLEQIVDFDLEDARARWDRKDLLASLKAADEPAGEPAADALSAKPWWQRRPGSRATPFGE